jgi:Sugar-transfer associated ATP-grasp
MKRILYLGYYIEQLDWEKFWLFLDYTSKETKKNKVSILIDVLISVFTYNISILEYFQFRFFEKSKIERNKWAGTGYMFEYQLQMNPKKERDILDDKTKFYKSYGKYFVHNVSDITGLKSNPELIEKLLNNPSGKLVFKVADGKCGVQVEIQKTSNFDKNSIISFMEKNKYDLVEEFIIQHPSLNELSPSAVNTVRIFTQLNVNNEVVILGCRQRISVNSSVDNMAAGNLAAPIDEETGIINGVAVYSDITKKDESKHPVTGVTIIGFQVPFWKETMAMTKEAALLHPQNRSIGWDIVITKNGPGFIEGNHDWCKLLWQLPAKKGLKSLIEPHFKS